MSKDDLLAALGVADTGTPDPELRGLYALAAFPNDWQIVFSNSMGFASPERLAKLSALGGEVVGVQIEEHVMFCWLQVYRGGAEAWGVLHDADKGIGHLQVTGSPPPELQPIIDRQRAEQTAAGGDDADTDFIFDIPTAAAEMVCGYALDGPDDPAAEWPVFTELKVIPVERPPSTGGFFSRLFGRR